MTQQDAEALARAFFRKSIVPRASPAGSGVGTLIVNDLVNLIKDVDLKARHQENCPAIEGGKCRCK